MPNSTRTTSVLLATIAALLAANLAVSVIKTFSPPAFAQGTQTPRVVALTLDQKYMYRAWSDGRTEAMYCRWVGDQDPSQKPNKWLPADPPNRP